MPKVSIIVLTYNSYQHISNLIESIEKFHKGLEDIEIIIVDNASTDKTLEVLGKSKVLHKVSESPKNIGFAAGINKGAKLARGEYLLILNPDTKFYKGSVWDMVRVFENNKNIGIVGGKMQNGEIVEKSSGKFLDLGRSLLLIFGLDERLGVRFSPNKITRVDFVSGGFMMIKRALFEKLGGFDEDYFMYVEDLDICKRAKDINFLTYFTPEVVVIHEKHGSSGREFAIENICKGLLIYHKKHSSKLTQTLVGLFLKLKAYFLVIVGRITNTNYLVDAYIGVTRL